MAKEHGFVLFDNKLYRIINLQESYNKVVIDLSEYTKGYEQWPESFYLDDPNITVIRESEVRDLIMRFRKG